ncbi:MAG TPA: hypothetical protein VKF38_08620 [Anaerolineaceae bacterium]|nr:hypothetical protein [Anaerolineaceae bacterium]
MLERLHENLIGEISHSRRTETLFIVVAIVFNLIALAINTVVAQTANASNYGYGNNSAQFRSDVTLDGFLLITILVNTIVVTVLANGRQSRGKLLDGLMALYSNQQVDQYYDKSLVLNDSSRSLLFVGVVILLALTAIVAPLVIRLL